MRQRIRNEAHNDEIDGMAVSAHDIFGHLVQPGFRIWHQSATGVQNSRLASSHLRPAHIRFHLGLHRAQEGGHIQ